MKYLLGLGLLIEIVLTCLIPTGKEYFFDKLQLHSKQAWIGLFFYVGILLALSIVQTLKPLLTTYVANTKRFILTNQYFQLGKDVINRDQRIQEDIKIYTSKSTAVYCEYIISFSIVVFLIFQNIHQIFLIVASIVYSVICIGAAYLYKYKLIQAEKDIQQVETDFRNHARSNNLETLAFVLKTNIKNSVIKFSYGICVQVQSGVMTLLPFMYLLPAFLLNRITLGAMMNKASIFELLVVNMAIIVNMWPSLMQSVASHDRVKELL